MAGPSRHRPEASMFSGSANPSFRDSEFKAAGHDFFNSPTFNVHFTAPFSEISTNQGKHEHRAPAGDLDRPRIVAPFKQFKWLLGFLMHHPQPLPVEGSPRPVSREVSDPSPVTVNNPLPSPELESSKHLPSQKKRKRTSSLGPPPSSKRHKPDDLRPYINVSCAHAFDPQMLQSHSLTTPQVYVRSMLNTGKGLACWKPRPRGGETRVVPGDVGTFSAEGGFRRTFNIWDDEDALELRASMARDTPFHLPPRNVATDPEEIAQGHTIAEGASSTTIYSEKRSKFRCKSCSGAILAATSAAEREELEDHVKLRKCIVQKAKLIYQHADEIRAIDDEEPLYLVTGCIRSDTWALAAFKEPGIPPHDLMHLENRTDERDDQPWYAWTAKSTSEAYFGSSRYPGIKDQTLFLVGFKLDFSEKFRRRMKHLSRAPGDASSDDEPFDHSDPPEADKKPRGSGPGGSGTLGDPSEGSSGGSGPGIRGGSKGKAAEESLDHKGWSASDGVSALSLPALQDTYHPSDAINKCLLNMVSTSLDTSTAKP
ncbi:hypothetical protein FA13DRAFT_1793449 [Coprinellus micaceus]|uniref:Uncharacterized protein n=1 Tax=Coprinellus micaceus TaxID=71717 RepID=A0A4Y7T5S2_COPMI|nr:hypothetical protein FA13DRAFT_1793449 [Coprinellus micaceus]